MVAGFADGRQPQGIVEYFKRFQHHVEVRLGGE
jgi:hypothetical protein